jgi:hypothetical protein
MQAMKKYLYIILFILCSCNSFTIDKAHYHFRKDPKGYEEAKDAKLVDNVMPCANHINPNNYIIDLITDTAQLNWAFWGNNNGQCYGAVPIVDFNNNSFIICSVHGYGQETYIKQSKVLIDYTNKIILCKFLVKQTAGAIDRYLPEGYIIPKVTNDYEVKIESSLTKY